MGQLLAVWQFRAFMAAIFAAPRAVPARLGVDVPGPDLAASVRTSIGATVPGAIPWFRGKTSELARINLGAGAAPVLSGLAKGASWLCQLRALKPGSASRVAPVDKPGVAFAAAFAPLFRGEGRWVTGGSGIAPGLAERPSSRQAGTGRRARDTPEHALARRSRALLAKERARMWQQAVAPAGR